MTSVVLKFSDKYIRSGRRQRGVHFSCVGTNMQFTSRFFFCPDDAAFEKCFPENFTNRRGHLVCLEIKIKRKNKSNKNGWTEKPPCRIDEMKKAILVIMCHLLFSRCCEPWPISSELNADKLFWLKLVFAACAFYSMSHSHLQTGPKIALQWNFAFSNTI